ncbi:MAG: cyclase family protein [Thermoplasmatota archaeon]|nr:cyclase family protein [Halobacteriales archaeon]
MRTGAWRQARQDAKAADHAVARGTAPGLRLIDISPIVNARIANWPGDVPYKMEKAADISADGIDIGSMHTSFHVGAHTDAHRHYAKDGPDAAGMPIGHYYGPCQVVDVRAKNGKRFGMDDLATVPTAPRVLFKTGTFPDPYEWNDDFAAPSPGLIDELAAKGVVLVGFDTPSTDLFASKGLESHKRLFAHGIVNLEGLVLADVKPGHYTLIAFPLRLEGADASPVRAVLVAT